MDPALLKEREAFKKRSQAIPVVEKKPSVPKDSQGVPPVKPKKKKKKSALSRPKPVRLQTGTSDSIKQAARSGHRSNNPARVLKAVVDMLKERYLTKVYDPLNIEEILSEIDVVELRTDTKHELYEALRKNTKVHYYSEADKFIFYPTLGHTVRNRHQLLNYLKEQEGKGMGGVSMTEIHEAVPQAAKVVEKLKDNIFRIERGERDKDDKILFYNNSELDMQVDEDIVTQWRQISVEGQSGIDIEKYLENVGLHAMQGEGRKRKASTQQKKSRKKSRQTKVLNTHLETGFLKEYSEDGTQITTPTD